MAIVNFLKRMWANQSFLKPGYLFRKEVKRFSGFTMIELIIGIIIYAIISMVIASVISNSLRFYADVRSRKDLNIDGQYSVFLFTREYSHLSESAGLLLADRKKIKFMTTQNNTVEYDLNTSLFTRKETVDGVIRTLAQDVDVTQSQFQYFENNHSELTSLPLSLTDRQKVWKVEFLITMANQTDTISYMANVYPENFRLSTEPCSEN